MVRTKTRTRGIKSRRRSKRGATRNIRGRKCPCQRGGLCLSGSCVAMGAMKMMGAGWVGKNVYRKYKSHSSRSSYRRSGNKRKIKRSEILELVDWIKINNNKCKITPIGEYAFKIASC